MVPLELESALWIVIRNPLEIFYRLSRFVLDYLIIFDNSGIGSLYLNLERVLEKSKSI